MSRLLWCTVVVCVACGACQKPAARLNAPPHGTCEEASPLQDQYTDMIDNALLADMAVSDIHFVPQRAILNSLGEERLGRLAGLLKEYGGTIRFSTDETEKTLVEARIQQVLAFLGEQDIDTQAEVLVQDLPASRGMDAAQAILIKVNEGTYHPKRGGDKGGDRASGNTGMKQDK